MVAAVAQAKATKRERWAWYLYDFGNSAYAAVVLLAVYSAYFQGQVVGGAEGSRLWGISVGIAMFVVAITSPILGTIADYSGSKIKFLLFFTVISCFFTGTLFLVKKGDVAMGMVFFILAEIGYRSAQVFYNALLPEIATPEEMGSVSGYGWAIGSAGGIICLFIILPLIVLIEGALIVRVSLLITAVFFAVSTIPIFVWLRERGQPNPLPKGETHLSLAFGHLWRTLRNGRRFREFVKFIVACLVYKNGVIMALDFAAIIGAVLFGLDQQMLIVFVIVVQFTNVAGAFAFGVLVDRVGYKRSLVWGLLMMIGAVLWMYVARSVAVFFVVGAVAGFAMAGLQSVSRTAVGMLSPPAQSAEFYGFFSVAGRTSAFIGPAIYGWIAAEAALWYQRQGQSMVLAEQSGQRLAILSIAVFLFVGLLLLLLVNEARGRQAAAAAAAVAAE